MNLFNRWESVSKKTIEYLKRDVGSRDSIVKQLLDDLQNEISPGNCDFIRILPNTLHNEDIGNLQKNKFPYLYKLYRWFCQYRHGITRTYFTNYKHQKRQTNGALETIPNRST